MNAPVTTHANGCCRDGACDASTCMDLPKGETCGTCVHAKRCTSMFGAELSDTSCGFFPRRFRRAFFPVENAHDR